MQKALINGKRVDNYVIDLPSSTAADVMIVALLNEISSAIQSIFDKTSKSHLPSVSL
jgi:hypothetical protein